MRFTATIRSIGKFYRTKRRALGDRRVGTTSSFDPSSIGPPLKVMR